MFVCFSGIYRTCTRRIITIVSSPAWRREQRDMLSFAPFWQPLSPLYPHPRLVFVLPQIALQRQFLFPAGSAIIFMGAPGWSLILGVASCLVCTWAWQLVKLKGKKMYDCIWDNRSICTWYFWHHFSVHFCGSGFAICLLYTPVSGSIEISVLVFIFHEAGFAYPKVVFDVTYRRRQRKTSTLRMRLRSAFQIANANRFLLKLCRKTLVLFIWARTEDVYREKKLFKTAILRPPLFSQVSWLFLQ